MGTILNTLNPFANHYEYFILVLKENNIFYTVLRNVISRSSFETQILNEDKWESIDKISEVSILNSCSMMPLNEFLKTSDKILRSGMHIDNASLVEACIKDLKHGIYHGCENEIMTIIENISDELIEGNTNSEERAPKEYCIITNHVEPDYTTYNRSIKPNTHNNTLSVTPRTLKQDIAA